MKNKTKIKILSNRDIPRTLKEFFMITKVKLNHTSEEALNNFLKQQKQTILPSNWHLNTQKIKSQFSKKDLEKGKKTTYIQIRIKNEKIIKLVEDCIAENYTSSKYFLDYFIVWYAKDYIKSNTEINDL